MPDPNFQEESKETEIKEEKKEEKDLTADEIFDQAFGEAAEAKDETDEDPPKDEEEEPPKDEDKDLHDEDESSDKEDIKQDETEAKVKSEDIVQQDKEEIKEEPPAKAHKEEAKEEPREVKKEEQAQVDFGLLFKDWEKDIDDPELKKELLEYASEMDTNAKYVNTATTVIGKRLVNYVNESFKVLIERMTPYFEATAKQIEKGHISTIRGAHEDFDSLKNNKDVETWIKEQPSYLQKSMMDVYTKGEAEDVIDLLGRYKKDRKIGVKSDEDISREKEVKKNIKEKVQETIDNLSVVKMKDRPVHIKQKSTNTDDFDSAFEEAASRR